MLSPSTRGRLLQTKNAGLGCFVVSLQARNRNKSLCHQQKRSLFDDHVVANMASYAISLSLILVIHDNMIIGTNHIVLSMSL
jgi:hypothetical protein